MKTDKYMRDGAMVPILRYPYANWADPHCPPTDLRIQYVLSALGG